MLSFSESSRRGKNKTVGYIVQHLSAKDAIVIMRCLSVGCRMSSTLSSWRFIYDGDFQIC